MNSQKTSLQISLPFARSHGIVVACDVPDLDALECLVKSTCQIDGVVGYKLGKILGYRYGLPRALETIRTQTELPVVFDGQKEGTDIPSTACAFVENYRACGVSALILFPFSGPKTQAALIRSCQALDVLPIGGFELSSPLFYEHESGILSDSDIENQGKYRGYIASDATARALSLFADLGVQAYIGPATKPDAVRRLRTHLETQGVEPVFMMPGIGGQGGSLSLAFDAAGANEGRVAYGIIGSAIYASKNSEEAAVRFAQEALSFEKKA